ncbi:Ca2+-binding protein, RTX toxin-related [Albimonas donghaensis]|uniref:Ca2+-binding protein, RTX toxin-related n=1 Tax=Albimonas donghaensis TaxID=356660 RepID=A0A1H2S919_9RHOB|nr:calcium-binding protein [Albimonas donghaensis]SDW28153.1 Ca2+-binding protein, RTX toxin-related [Albimonas donghaensis]
MTNDATAAIARTLSGGNGGQTLTGGEAGDRLRGDKGLDGASGQLVVRDADREAGEAAEGAADSVGLLHNGALRFYAAGAAAGSGGVAAWTIGAGDTLSAAWSQTAMHYDVNDLLTGAPALDAVTLGSQTYLFTAGHGVSLSRLDPAGAPELLDNLDHAWGDGLIYPGAVAAFVSGGSLMALAGGGWEGGLTLLRWSATGLSVVARIEDDARTPISDIDAMEDITVGGRRFAVAASADEGAISVWDITSTNLRMTDKRGFDDAETRFDLAGVASVDAAAVDGRAMVFAAAPDALVVYALSGTGRLTRLSSIEGATEARHVSLDGRDLLFCADGGDTLRVYEIASTGRLDLVRETRVGWGAEVSALSVTASGDRALVLAARADADGHDLLSFAFEEGDDTIDGGGGRDSIWGDGGDDLLIGGADVDRIWGGEGADRIQGGTETDWLYGEAGADSVDGGAGRDNIWGGEGSDRLFGGDDMDKLFGGSGADTLDGGGHADTLNGGDGADRVLGGWGDDVMTGDAGDDYMDGGDGYDRIDGGAGSDSILGGAGADTISGGEGDDRIEGGDAPDAIDAGAGDDVAMGGEGADDLTGGAGADRLLGGNGDDTLRGGDDADDLQGEAGDDAIWGEAGDDALLGGDGADLLDGGDGADVMRGWTGDDRLLGGNDDDFLFGDAGDDVLDGGAGDDRLLSGAGADAARGGGGRDLIKGQGGNDRVEGGGGADKVFGQGGDDFVFGGGGKDLLKGNGGNDLLDGGGGKDVLKAGGGRDALIGGGGRDQLVAGGGHDLLIGGRGADVLKGGRGRDDFQFGARDGKDTVKDFALGLDQLEFTGADDMGDLRISTFKGDAMVAYGKTKVILDGIDARDLGEGDFLFD